MHRCAPVNSSRITASQSSGFHAHGQAVARDGGVVHQNVESAEFFDDLLESGFHLFGVGYIHLHCQRFAAGSPISETSAASFSSLRAADGDFCARFHESQSRVAADSLRRAGNESYFIFQSEHGNLFALTRRRRGPARFSEPSRSGSSRLLR